MPSAPQWEIRSGRVQQGSHSEVKEAKAADRGPPRAWGEPAETQGEMMLVNNSSGPHRSHGQMGINIRVRVVVKQMNNSSGKRPGNSQQLQARGGAQFPRQAGTGVGMPPVRRRGQHLLK